MTDFIVAEKRKIINLCATLRYSPLVTMKISPGATGKSAVCHLDLIVNKWHSLTDFFQMAESQLKTKTYPVDQKLAMQVLLIWCREKIGL